MSLWDTFWENDVFDDPMDISGKHAKEAGEKGMAAQRAAAAEAARVQKEIYEQQRKDAAPWREGGQWAIGQMQDKDYYRDFGMEDYQADPGYMFRLQEGQKALERSAAARGGLQSGGTLKGLERYAQGQASQEYQAAYDRFNADRDRRFGRLGTVSGQGLQATGMTGQAAQNYGNNVSGYAIGMGNAEAASYMGQEQLRSQRLNSIMSLGGMMFGGIGGAAGGAAKAGGSAGATTGGGMFGQAAKTTGGNPGYYSGSVGNAADMYSFSDRRLKKEIQRVSKEDLAELKANLTAYKFKYQNEEHGKGDFIGVMAQDLQKSKLGKTLVVEDEQGRLQVDLGRVMNLFLATMAEA